MRKELKRAAREAFVMYLFFVACWIFLLWASHWSYRHMQTCEVNTHHTPIGPFILFFFSCGAAFLACVCAKSARHYNEWREELGVA